MTERRTLGKGDWQLYGCAATVTRWPTAVDALTVARVFDQHGCGNPQCDGEHRIETTRKGEP